MRGSGFEVSFDSWSASLSRHRHISLPLRQYRWQFQGFYLAEKKFFHGWDRSNRKLSVRWLGYANIAALSPESDPVADVIDALVLFDASCVHPYRIEADGYLSFSAWRKRDDRTGAASLNYFVVIPRR